MLIRVFRSPITVNVQPQIARVVRVYNYNTPSGITSDIVTEAGQLIGSDGSGSPVAITAPDTEGQMLIARLGQTSKMMWEDVDLSQLTQTAVKTAAYTASNNDHVLVDASGASADFAVTLPASPSAGQKVRVTMVAQHATYKVTINRNSSNVNGGTDTSAFDLKYAGKTVYFEYGGATIGWIGIGGGQDVVQQVSSITGAEAHGTTILPWDDTIPQNTEGDQYLSLAITPKNIKNRLRIDVILQVSHTNANAEISAALFQDTTAGALAAQSVRLVTANSSVEITFTHEMAAGTVSATTFKVRAGGAGAGTLTLNGVSSARKFGGVQVSSIIITELTP